MKSRINLGEGRTGWEYNYANICSVRKFDDGDKTYFFHTEWNGYHRKSYFVHVDQKDGPFKYRVTIKINFRNNESHEFSSWSATRKTAFAKLRKEINITRRALRTLKLE